MKHQGCGLFFIFCVLAVVSRPGLAEDEPKDLAGFCRQTFEQEGVCPGEVCDLVTGEAVEGEEPVKSCQAKACPDIKPDDCPEDYCAVMEDCSGRKICHFQMPGEQAECGDIAYAGQDVPCCPGLVRRCGIEFLDGTCDMEGQNSVYNLPICIPCGDGICGNFENRCNCPEDCGTPPKHGGSQRDLPFAYIKPLPAQQADQQADQQDGP